ncbi:VOC family protein [Acidisoma sp. C75]
MKVTPYLFFNGRCQEALDFYAEAVGAEITFLMRYRDCPEPMDSATMPPGQEEKIMHVSFRIGETELMASDGSPMRPQHFDGFALSLLPATENEAERHFAALGEGGQVRMPMRKTFFSPAFGMLTDRFGVTWTVYVPQPIG